MGMGANYDITGITRLLMSDAIAKIAFSQSMIDNQRNYSVSIDNNARSVSLEVDFPKDENIS